MHFSKSYYLNTGHTICGANKGVCKWERARGRWLFVRIKRAPRLDCHRSGVIVRHAFIFTATSCRTSFKTLAWKLNLNTNVVRIVQSKVRKSFLELELNIALYHDATNASCKHWHDLCKNCNPGSPVGLRSQHSFPESYWSILSIGPNTQLELKPNDFVGSTVLPPSSLSSTSHSHSALLALPQHESPEASLTLWQVTEVFCQLSSNRWEVIETTGN